MTAVLRELIRDTAIKLDSSITPGTARAGFFGHHGKSIQRRKFGCRQGHRVNAVGEAVVPGGVYRENGMLFAGNRDGFPVEQKLR